MYVSDYCQINCSVVNIDEDLLDTTSELIDLEPDSIENPTIDAICGLDWANSQILDSWYAARGAYNSCTVSRIATDFNDNQTNSGHGTRTMDVGPRWPASSASCS